MTELLRPGTNHQWTALEEWLEGRPECIQQMARECPPWNEYRIKSTGQTCELLSYSEDGTVTVNITSFTPEHLFGGIRQVFGIDFFDLEALPERVERTKSD